MSAIGLLVLRLTLATVLVAHGGHQLFGLFGDGGAGPGGLAATAARFSALDLDPGFPLALLGGVIQLVGGALIGLGLLTRWASAAAIGYLAIGLWLDQWQWGFFMNWMADPARGHGVEYSLALVGALACLVLAGGGDLSVDGWRGRSATARESARVRLRSRG